MVNLAKPVAPIDESLPVFILLPVLHEEAVLEISVSYFVTLAETVDAKIVIVTSDREFASTVDRAGTRRESTYELADQLADGESILHLHLADADAFKGDQLNFAASHIQANMDTPNDDALLVIYDIDSRPDLGSLADFVTTASNWGQVDVFHQSARFELRSRPRSFSSRVADAGALRANRFVASTEVPRLLARSPKASTLRKTLSSVTYGHVTGHGLCLRLSRLTGMPLPTHTLMEDMYYSFLLASAQVPVVPTRTLDQSEVPASLNTQFRQLERWFLGPARGPAYFKDPAAVKGVRSALIAIGTVLITLEWLSSAASVPVLMAASTGRPASLRNWLRMFCVMTFAELLSAEILLGDQVSVARRAQRIVLYPIAVAVFGVAGWSSIARSIRSKNHSQKTDRSIS